MSCLICDRPDVEAINTLLHRGHTAYLVAVKYGVSQGTMYRHAQHRMVATEREEALPPAPASHLSRFHPEMLRLSAYVETVRDPATQRLLGSLFEVLTAMTEED